MSLDTATLVLTLGAYVAATISGVLGMGGGVLLLALMLAAGWEPALVVPLHALVQLASNATRVAAYLPHTRWRPALWLMAAATPGPLLGLWIIGALPLSGIKALMAATILYATWVPKWGLQRLSQRVSWLAAGALGGVLGVVVGAVGPLIAPFFLHSELDKEALVGTKAVCVAYLHLLKLVAFGAVGFAFGEHLLGLVPLLVAVVAGTFTGRFLLGRLSEEAFRWIYKVVLTLLALRLIWA